MNKCPLSGKPCPKVKLFHVTEIVDKKTVSFDLCEDCIGKFADLDKKKTPSGGTPVPVKVGPVEDKDKKPAPGDVLKTMMEFIGFVLDPPPGLKKPKPPEQKVPPHISKEFTKACPNCGCTLEDIAKTAKLGCPKCYEEFSEHLDQILQHAHGAIKHVGKVPKNWKKQQAEKDINPIKYIVEMNQKLNLAVKEERYEEAAQIRNKLTVLEGLRSRLEDNVNGNDHEQAELIRKEIVRFIQLDRAKEAEE